jgi:hypothetical protein
MKILSTPLNRSTTDGKLLRLLLKKFARDPNPELKLLAELLAHHPQWKDLVGHYPRRSSLDRPTHISRGG